MARVLFIGGTGNISGACSARALAEGHELWLLTRGSSATPAGARSIVCDVADEAALDAALAGRTFDAVVNFVAFDLPDVERDLRVFHGRCGQYVFVSTAACYRKPWPRPVTEDVPLDNEVWPYARKKIACERRLARAMDEGVCATIVRPSLTYDTVIPLPLVSWGSFTLVDRMLRGRPIVVHGDGTTPFTVTHAEDFAVGLVGLLGNPRAIGEAFHITGDELLTWDELHRAVAAAAGAPPPTIVHMTSEDIAALLPDRAGSLLGDKAHASAFDNAKLKAAVPGFMQRIPFAEGIRRTIAWFRADPSRLCVDAAGDAAIDRLLAAHAALRAALR
jgi:nucleoside-diphosphate-sugar epimerase